MIKNTLMNTARFLKYFWPFFNIMHENAKLMLTSNRKINTLLDFNNTFQKKIRCDLANCYTCDDCKVTNMLKLSVIFFFRAVKNVAIYCLI